VENQPSLSIVRAASVVVEFEEEETVGGGETACPPDAFDCTMPLALL
jgi:hypothetical protein